MADAPAAAPPFPIQTDWDSAPPALSDAHLERYLAFTGAGAPAAPTIAALAEIQRAHLYAIPFENLSPILGEPVSLDHAALTAKLLSGTRGGYCFEHNMLLGGALVALGYEVRLLSARALIGLLPGEVRPRTHLALLVTAQDAQPRLVDAGFGRATLNGPLDPAPELVQEAGGDFYRLVDHGGELAMEAAKAPDGPWTALYLADPRPVYPVDVEMANHFVATHALSHMRRTLVLLRATPAGKRTLAFKTTPTDQGTPEGGELLVDEAGRQERRAVAADELDAVLREEFGIVPPAPVGHLLG